MESNLSKLKTYWIFGFAVDCPALKNNQNCPFHAIRKLPLAERFEIVEKMDYDKIRSFMFTHSNCHFNNMNPITVEVVNFITEIKTS